MKKFRIMILSLLLAGPLSSMTYLEGVFLGDPAASLDSPSLAMGGTGLGYNKTPAALRNNPANISLARRITAQVNTALFVSSERILNTTKPGSELEYSDANINNQVYFQVNSAGVIVPVVSSLYVGLDYHQPFDFHYRNSTYQYQDANRRTGFGDYSQSGVLNSYSLALAYQYKGTLALGASVNVLRGAVESKDKVTSYPYRHAILVNKETAVEMNGMSFNLGFNAGITRRLNVGVFYQTGTKLSFQSSDKDLLTGTESQQDYYILYPKRYGAGLAYRLLAGYDTTLAVDFIFTPWDRDARTKDTSGTASEEMRLDQLDPYRYLADTHEIHLGAEHIFILVPKVLKLPFRYGLMWLPSYMNDRVQMAMFTLGFGLEGAWFRGINVRLDISAGLGKRNYIGIYGRDPLDPPVSDDMKQRVDESVQVVNAGLIVEF